jgi:predicted permease
VPPILIAVCAIFLGGVFQYIFKNGINMLFAFVFGTAGLISYLTDFKVTPTNIHNQTFLYPSLVYAGLIVIGAVVSYFLINKMNIKV